MNSYTDILCFLTKISSEIKNALNKTIRKKSETGDKSKRKGQSNKWCLNYVGST